MEQVRVFLLDLPDKLDGFTINIDTDVYHIFINAKLASNQQHKVYTREVGYVDHHEYNKMYTLTDVERLMSA